MHFETARFNMIHQQIRPYDVLDDRVLARIAEVPRERFVPPGDEALAFVDMCLPIGRGEVMLPPKLEARLLQVLAVRSSDRILEIGTGSGYMTALLAGLGAHVFSVELVPEFKRQAEQRLQACGIQNVTLEVGDGAHGWARHAPYDAIVLTGSVAVLDPAFAESLAEGGRLVAIVGTGPTMEMRRIERLAGGMGIRETSVVDVHAPALRNSALPERFVF